MFAKRIYISRRHIHIDELILVRLRLLFFVLFYALENYQKKLRDKNLAKE